MVMLESVFKLEYFIVHNTVIFSLFQLMNSGDLLEVGLLVHKPADLA